MTNGESQDEGEGVDAEEDVRESGETTDAAASRQRDEASGSASEASESTSEASESASKEKGPAETSESTSTSGEEEYDRGLSVQDLPLMGPIGRSRWWDRGIVFTLGALVFIPLLGAFGLWDPWETHYGEVARQITERNDWISTWWGSHWEDGQGQTEGSHFFSKPILLMWMMAAGLEVFGFSEWGIRLGVTLVALLGLTTVYTFGAGVFRRRTGFLMAAVLGSAPFYFFLSRQAQTDMPFVGLMTVGLCFFMMAMFGEDRNEPADKVTYGLTFGFLGLVVVPQVWLILVGLSRWRGYGNNPVMAELTHPPEFGLAVAGVPLAVAGLLELYAFGFFHAVGRAGRGAARWVHETVPPLRAPAGDLLQLLPDFDDPPEMVGRRWGLWSVGIAWLPQVVILALVLANSAAPARDLNGWSIWGPTQAALYGTCFLTAAHLVVKYPIRERRRLYLLVFYVFIALATLAKGLLGFLLPGAVLFFYILLTREWSMLKRVEFVPGTLLFIAACFPWYAGMLIRHTRGFWQRFFVHDHFKRFASGVHQIDTGSIEHFVRWLGYGLFPWSALIPASLAQFFTGRGLDLRDDSARARLMLLLWAMIAFTLFTLSSTKFHHYIFPTVPPLALLVALAVDDALDREVPEPWPLYLVALPIFALIAWDFIADPQLLKDLFTYKYERKWDAESWNSGFRFWLTVVCIPGALGLVWMLVRNRVVRRVSFGLVFLTGLGMAIFGLDVYMPEVSSTWSQKGVWDAYYAHCQRRDVPEDREARADYCEETGEWDICEYYDPKKRYCEEEAIAYKLNWRGETYYTQNEVIPVRDDDDWDAFIERQGDEAFYGIMQRGRYHGGFKRSLPERFEGDSCIIYEKNIKFILIKVPCSEQDRERADRLFSDDSQD